MVLNTFDLTGKVAIVTGCDTGLGQGMTLALAQAGCDIVGVNRKIPHETAEQVRRSGVDSPPFRLTSAADAIADIVAQAVSAMGRVDILVNNAGTIRRADALTFSEKSGTTSSISTSSRCSFYRRRSPGTLFSRAAAERSLTSPPCSRFRAGFASPRIRPQKRRARFNPPDGQRMGRAEYQRQCHRPGYMATDNTRSYAMMPIAVKRSSTVSRPGAGASRMIYRARSRVVGCELHQWIYAGG